MRLHRHIWSWEALWNELHLGCDEYALYHVFHHEKRLKVRTIMAMPYITFFVNNLAKGQTLGKVKLFN